MSRQSFINMLRNAIRASDIKDSKPCNQSAEPTNVSGGTNLNSKFEYVTIATDHNHNDLLLVVKVKDDGTDPYFKHHRQFLSYKRKDAAYVSYYELIAVNFDVYDKQIICAGVRGRKTFLYRFATETWLSMCEISGDCVMTHTDEILDAYAEYLKKKGYKIFKSHYNNVGGWFKEIK